MAEVPTAPGASRMQTPGGDPPQAPVLVRVLLVLCFGTGVVDAVSFLELGVFTAIMTGNIVFVGLGLADQTDVPLLRAPIAIAAFTAGALLVGRVQRRVDASVRCPRSSGWLLVAAACLVALAAGLSSAASLPDRTAGVMTALLGAAMGLQVGAVRRMAVPDLSTVVVTLALAGWALDSRLGRGDRIRAARRLAAVCLLLLGALVGGLLVHVSPVPALGLSCLLLAVAAVTVLHVGEHRSPGRLGRVTG